MTLETEQPNITRKSQLIGYVRHRVMLLQKGSQEHRSGTLGDLARLRRMQRLNSDPRLWRVIFEDMPVALLGRDTAPSTAEQAVQASLGLFAVHEQSTPSPVHVQDPLQLCPPWWPTGWSRTTTGGVAVASLVAFTRLPSPTIGTVGSTTYAG